MEAATDLQANLGWVGESHRGARARKELSGRCEESPTLRSLLGCAEEVAGWLPNERRDGQGAGKVQAQSPPYI